MLQEHVLIAYCGKQVGVHYQHIVVRQPVDKLGCSDCAEFAWFAHAAHVDAAHRTREMLIELLCEVVGRDGNVSHPVPGKSLHVVVDDALVADFEQRLRGGQCQRSQPLSATASHHYGVERQDGVAGCEVVDLHDAAFAVEARHERDSLSAHLAHLLHAYFALFEASEVAVHYLADCHVERAFGNQKPSHVAVGQSACHALLVVDGEKHHRLSRQPVYALYCLYQRGVLADYVFAAVVHLKKNLLESEIIDKNRNGQILNDYLIANCVIVGKKQARKLEFLQTSALCCN